MTTVADRMLSGDWPNRQESVRWDLLDSDRNPLGQLMVSADQPAKITNDAGRTIRRSTDQVHVPARPVVDRDPLHFYADDVNPFSQLVQPWWVLGDTPFPLGVFTFGGDSRTTWSWGRPRVVTLTDLMTQLDQPLDRLVAYGTGASVYNALLEQAEAAGFNDGVRNIEFTTVTLGAPVAWLPGRDTRLKVFESLCTVAGFLPAYFDNNGLLTLRSASSMEATSPAYEYGTGAMPVVAGTAVAGTDRLTAPNRYVVVVGTAFGPLVGIYDIPDAAPNSFANTGRRVRKTFDVQGIGTIPDAVRAAQAAYVADASTYVWAAFDSPVDPRQDTWDVVALDGVAYRQMSWSIDARPGGLMHHDLRGIYAS